jgi:hypothetical protein
MDADRKLAQARQSVGSGTSEMVLPTVSGCYSPTYQQWRRIVTETEFFAEGVNQYSHVEFIDFVKSKIYLLGGIGVSFDCLSEHVYVHVCNGGYFEEAVPIEEESRI